jgi:NADPH2:quinone reductase
MVAVSPTAGSPTPELTSVPVPRPGAGELLLRVEASGVNHVDLLQQRGRYAVPEGESEIPGLECSGSIAALGDGLVPGEPWSLGDRVMALLGGGGHARYVVAPEQQVMRLPADWNFALGAALPEAGVTAWTNLVAEGGLRRGEWVMVTGATGGVGRLAVQLAEALGAHVVAVSRSGERLSLLPLSDESATVREGADFTTRVHRATGGAAIDLVLDLVGGPAFAERVECLGSHGRVILVGLLAGTRSNLDLSRTLRCQLMVKGSLLRARPRQEKGRLVEGFMRFAEPRFATGALRPAIAAEFAAGEIAAAYAALERGGLDGKVVVHWDGETVAGADTSRA